MCVWNRRNIYIRCTRWHVTYCGQGAVWSWLWAAPFSAAFASSFLLFEWGSPFSDVLAALACDACCFWFLCSSFASVVLDLEAASSVAGFCMLLQKHPRRLDIVYLASICKDGTGDLRTAMDCLLLAAFKCLPHSTAPGSWYGLLDTAAGGINMWFGCNMLQFSMPIWPCLVAKLCGVAPKELAWDGLARNSKSIRQIERS